MKWDTSSPASGHRAHWGRWAMGRKQLAIHEPRRKSGAIQTQLLQWARSHSREYAWRQSDRTPYEIMMAELLLKRTTAAAAARIYESFLHKYPTPARLAAASEEQLAQDLAPVGLNTQRAKAITKLARHLVENEAGKVPCTLERLLKVPGLGDYSARAILSFGCGIPVAVVDANVIRVLRRVFQRVLPTHPTRSMLQALADSLLPKDTHRELNFGLLDLGALVCRYANPRCGECPLMAICDYVKDRPPLPHQSALRAIRQAKSVSLVELTQRARVAKLTIINIEAGRTTPRPETMRKLADALGVAVKKLTGRRKR